MIDQNSQFFAILTAVGEAKQANATALGQPWTFAQMGVGDANLTDPIPNRTHTRLINEWRRAPVNQVRTDPANPNIIITEQVIPADVGGKWIREIGLYDADGDMVAVANCAPSFKPLLVQGTGKTQIIRMNFIVANTASVVLKIDPAIVLATREYVDTQIIEAMAKMDFKHSVLVATTVNIVLSGIQTIDGVLLPADSRVLVKDQIQSKDNGIYVVPSGGAWKRSQDADASVEVTPGLFVSVEKGTTNGDSVWQLVTDAPIVLGTTALTFEVVAGRTGIVAGTYRSLTVDKNGRVIAGTNPTTLAGSGITDALSSNGGVLAGPVQLTENSRVYVSPGSTAAWGLGMFAGVPAAIKGGVGFYGGADGVFKTAFIGLGTDPWAAGPGIRIKADGAVEIGGTLAGNGAGLYSVPFSALTGVPTTLSAYGITAASQDEAEQGSDTNKPMTALRVWQAIAAKVKQATESSFGWVQIATQTAVSTGTDDRVVVTPKTLDFRLSQLLIQATEAVFGWAKVANQAAVNAGLNDAAYVTPKKLRFGFLLSLADNGYVGLPTWMGGVIIQWGYTPATVMDSDVTTSFPIAFPTACRSAIPQAANPAGSLDLDSGPQLKSISASSFTCRIQNYVGGSAAPVGFYWLAIGH